MKEMEYQIFALFVWRFHNTQEAWDKLKEGLLGFMELEDFDELRDHIKEAYGETENRSYLFFNW